MDVKVLVVDDHPLMRRGVHQLLRETGGFQFVGEAESGKEAVRQCREQAPDIVIMDVSMSNGNGVEATRQILAQSPQTRVLALSVNGDYRCVTEMLKAGAKGYVLKTCLAEELVLAVRALMANQSYLSPNVASVVTNGYMERLDGDGHPPAEALTPCQRQVLKLLVEGLSIKQIAQQLKRSTKTVEMHRRHLMEKVGVSSMAGLTKFALRHGMATLDD